MSMPKRLTKKFGENDYAMSCTIDEYGIPDAKESANKLGQLEDLEEELGIELVLYFKIYKHCLKRKPIYYIKNNQIIKSSPRVECCLGSVAEHVGDYGADDYDFRDYGKTWALTKEELL